MEEVADCSCPCIFVNRIFSTTKEQPKRRQKMMIKKITCAVFTAMAVMLCQGGISAPTASDYDDDYEEDWDDEDEEEEVRKLDLDEESEFSFSFEDDFPEEIGGYEVLTEFLPDGVSLEWTGKKLKAPKAGKVKYSKKEGGFIDKKDSDNPSGLTVKYNKKKGTVSGSFKVYVAKSEKKLKTYKAKFSGKLGGSLKVTVKKGVVTTAVIE